MKKACLVLLATVFIVMSLSGCNNKYFQINPSVETENYKMFGHDLGIFLKAKHPGIVLKIEPDIKIAVLMTDEELISGNVLQTAYVYAMKTWPEEAEMIFVAKSGINLFGIKIDISSILPEERPLYLTNVRALIVEYLKATEGTILRKVE